MRAGFSVVTADARDQWIAAAWIALAVTTGVVLNCAAIVAALSGE